MVLSLHWYYNWACSSCSSFLSKQFLGLAEYMEKPMNSMSYNNAKICLMQKSLLFRSNKSIDGGANKSITCRKGKSLGIFLNQWEQITGFTMRWDPMKLYLEWFWCKKVRHSELKIAKWVLENKLYCLAYGRTSVLFTMTNL